MDLDGYNASMARRADEARAAFEAQYASPPAPTIFAEIVEEARIWVEPLGDLSSGQACEVATAVIQAIIDRTPSPATVVELTRILREGGVEVPEVTFD